MPLRALPELYENAFEGVNTAVSPEMISPNQLQWGKNIVNRGAKPTTRPPWIYRMSLPSGLVQGASYFGVQGGMGVASIAGNIWRLRIGPTNYTAEQIVLPWRNSAVIKKVYMQQTVETLVIQDGQSNPILYDGSTAERSDPTAGGVPRGTVMAYGNGRLWVAINSKELVAGDIRTNAPGSELLFTETNYLSGGGTLYFPRGITALGFIATTGTSDYGALLVFGLDYTESVRADITFRDLWAQTPGFVTNVLRHTGCASHWSLAEVNQDLYWRDAGGGLRSIRSALADESGPGNAPISREISRLTDFDSRQLLPFASSISFNNRLITTCSPYLNESRGVSWKDLAPLDFAPMSTMRGKTFPSYDGEWDGLNFTHLFQGQFNGRSRAFGVASNPDGTNALWELMEDGRGGLDDVTVVCTDGSSTATPYPITAMLESGARSAGDSKIRKRAERCDVFISDMLGEVNLKVYWRVDNNQKWLLWDEGVDVCAKNGDPEVPGASTHVWKNILSQQRPQIKTYTVPTNIDPITAFALQTGYEFQVRLVWTGRLKIDKFILWLRPLPESPYADRELVIASCLTNDVTGNEVVYQIPFTPCPPVPSEVVFEQYDGPFEIRYLTQEIEGDNRAIYSFAFLGVDHSHSAGLVPLTSTTAGLQYTEWSGDSTYNPNTDTYAGPGLTVNYREAGVIPAGVNYYHPAGEPITITENTFDDLMLALQIATNSGIMSRSVTEGPTADGSYVKKWFSETPGPAVGGYFAGYTMARIWSDGWTVTLTYSNQQTPASLGIPIARTGVPAQCQLVTDYDPDTFTYTGTKSRVREDVVIPVGRTKLYGDFVYLVTPEDGSAPYNYYDSKEYDVMGGTTYNAVTWFPWIVGATVCYVSGKFSFTPSYFLGYTTPEGASNEFTELPGSATWPELVAYGMPPRNGEAWDDFADYGGTDTNPSQYLIRLFTGYGWAEEWVFYGTDPVDAYDEFTSYADGALAQLTQGSGWAAVGFFFQIPPWDASDDFETYADGPITSLDVPGDFWQQPGFFF